MAHAELTASDKRKRWRARNPDKDRAHRIVENYTRRLKRAGLPKPNCAIDGCATPNANVQAHHTDYTRPLDVVWLCAHHHIVGHWDSQWRAERNIAPGKTQTLIYLNHTIAVMEDTAEA